LPLLAKLCLLDVGCDISKSCDISKIACQGWACYAVHHTVPPRAGAEVKAPPDPLLPKACLLQRSLLGDVSASVPAWTLLAGVVANKYSTSNR
jgi:hypothetical protein